MAFGVRIGSLINSSKWPPEFRGNDAFRANSVPLRNLQHCLNTDLAPIYGSAIADIKKEGKLRSRCCHRPVQYLNNIIEQDHRAIKRRVNAKQGFREFQAMSQADSCPWRIDRITRRLEPGTTLDSASATSTNRALSRHSDCAASGMLGAGITGKTSFNTQ